MARFNVVHSEDAATIIIRGSKKSPEPSTAIIKFPGGHVEVARCTDGTYWAHVRRDVQPQDEDQIVIGEVIGSRIDMTGGHVPSMPDERDVVGFSLRIGRVEKAAARSPTEQQPKDKP